MAGNRVLNETKIKKIINDIDSGLNMLSYCPIVVNEQMMIIDGQHRFQVCKILKHPVYFIIAKNVSLYDIARINSRTERWKPVDYMRCYAEIGNKHYQKLVKFIETFEGMPVSSGVFLLCVGLSSDKSSRMLKQFERGEFEIASYADAERIALIAATFQTNEFKSHFSVNFLKAIRTILKADLCDIDLLFKQYAKAPHLLHASGNPKSYLTDLELIYNYNAQKRKPIY